MLSSDRYCSPFAAKYRDQPYTSATHVERLVRFQISSTQALDHAAYIKYEFRVEQTVAGSSSSSLDVDPLSRA